MQLHSACNTITNREIMGQDTVLLGGLGFLLFGGVAWFLWDRLQQSNWSVRAKRLGTYALVGSIIIVAILIIDWHSSNYKAGYETSYLYNSGVNLS